MLGKKTIQLLHQLRLIGSEIVLFTEIFLKIVKLRHLLALFHDVDQLPIFPANAVDLVVVQVMRRSGAWLAHEDVERVLSVDGAIFGHLAANQLGEGGEEVGGHRNLVRFHTGGNRAWPPGDGWDPHVAFVLWSSLTATKRAHAHAPGAAVVGGEENQRLLIDLEIAKSVEDTAHAGVDLFDVGPVGISLGLGENLRTSEPGVVHVGVRHEAKERSVPMRLDELNGLVGDNFTEKRLIGAIGDISHRLILTNDGQGLIGAAIGDRVAALVPWPHVVGIGNPEVFLESLGEGEKGLLITKVPLAEAAGGVALFLQHLGDGDFVRVESSVLAGENDGSVHANAMRIAAGEQGRARGGAGSVGNVKLPQRISLRRHPIEVGCLVHRIPERTDVAVAHVVDEDDDDVGLRLAHCRVGRADRREEAQKTEQESEGGMRFHGVEGG